MARGELDVDLTRTFDEHTRRRAPVINTTYHYS